MINAILIKFGEIFIRKKNRKKFFDILINNISEKLVKFNNVEVFKEQGRIILILNEESIHYEEIITELLYVQGIVSLSPCVMTDDNSVSNLCKLALELVNKEKLSNKSFKVKTVRGFKDYPLLSAEISSNIGSFLYSNVENLTVNLKEPDFTVNVELRNYAYVYLKLIRGLSGLPLGSLGKSVLLLSGGIDSPVAGFLMARRGLDFEAIYFHSPPYTSELALLKVKDIAEKLQAFNKTLKLNVVNFTDVQLYLCENVRENKTTIFLKRAMLKASELLADTIEAKGLILGDCIGQVASQTLDSMHAIDSAVEHTILRPCLALDKEDIINYAKKINTYDISTRPYEDCCTVFVPRHPDLKPKKSYIESRENALIELNELIKLSIEQREIIIFK